LYFLVGAKFVLSELAGLLADCCALILKDTAPINNAKTENIDNVKFFLIVS
jgi:hypothetical protein